MSYIKYNNQIVSISEPTDSILEILEKNNLYPNYQCRNGICGSCRCQLLTGEIRYQNLPLAYTKKGDVLICIAQAKGSVELNSIE